MNRKVGNKLKVAIIAIAIISLAVAVYLVSGKDSRDRFIRAVAEGDIKTVRELLKEDETLAQTQLHHRKAGTFRPVIQIAVSRGHQDVAKLLLSYDIDVRQISPALRLADSPPMAELLIAHGANVNWRSANGSTAMHFFAAVDNLEMMEFLVDNGAIVNVTDRSGQTPLHKAAREGRLNAAKLLVSEGADISAKSEEGKTPFDYAAMPVWNEDAYRLQQRRIDRCKEVAAYLLSCGSTATVFDLAWLGDMERFRAVIKSNPSLVNERAHEEPLLFAAIRGGSADVVEYLLTHGAKLRVTSRHQQSPLRLAAYMGHTDVARILLDHGVDVDEKGQWGETALHWAAVKDNAEVAALLLEKGADADSQTSGHVVDLNVRAHDADPVERELSWFRTRERQRRSRYLQVAVPPRLAFTTGDTPIHAATYWNHADVVRLLIANGADISSTNRWRETPLHYAVACRYHNIAERLLKSGADPKAKTHEGMTPVDIAGKVKDKRLITMLSDRKRR